MPQAFTSTSTSPACAGGAAIGPVASGGRPRLKALLVQGRVVVQDDAIPGLDLAALRREAQALVDRMR